MLIEILTNRIEIYSRQPFASSHLISFLSSDDRGGDVPAYYYRVIRETLTRVLAQIWLWWTTVRKGEDHKFGLPRASKGTETDDIWQTWLHRAVGCLVCESLGYWHCPLPPLWSSKFSRLQSGHYSSSLQPFSFAIAWITSRSIE